MLLSKLIYLYWFLTSLTSVILVVGCGGVCCSGLRRVKPSHLWLMCDQIGFSVMRNRERAKTSLGLISQGQRQPNQIVQLSRKRPNCMQCIQLLFSPWRHHHGLAVVNTRLSLEMGSTFTDFEEISQLPLKSQWTNEMLEQCFVMLCFHNSCIPFSINQESIKSMFSFNGEYSVRFTFGIGCQSFHSLTLITLQCVCHFQVSLCTFPARVHS